MNHFNTTSKRLFIYMIGTYFIALGASFSILANIGVSPVTAFPYALSLITGLTVGTMTVFANILFISIQAILLKKVLWKDFFIQLSIVSVFGLFLDITLWLMHVLPEANSIWLISLYLALSIIIVAFGIMLYATVKFPMMPYDTLTAVVAAKWQIPFGKSKIICDMTVVGVSLITCLVFIHSFGSIGIGTFIAAYGLGKILGSIIPVIQPKIRSWVFAAQQEVSL
ncbi:MAG: DUF6198 family protein [Solibacillus sp.]